MSPERPAAGKQLRCGVWHRLHHHWFGSRIGWTCMCRPWVPCDRHVVPLDLRSPSSYSMRPSMLDGACSESSGQRGMRRGKRMGMGVEVGNWRVVREGHLSVPGGIGGYSGGCPWRGVPAGREPLHSLFPFIAPSLLSCLCQGRRGQPGLHPAAPHLCHLCCPANCR